MRIKIITIILLLIAIVFAAVGSSILWREDDDLVLKKDILNLSNFSDLEQIYLIKTEKPGRSTIYSIADNYIWFCIEYPGLYRFCIISVKNQLYGSIYKHEESGEYGPAAQYKISGCDIVKFKEFVKTEICNNIALIYTDADKEEWEEKSCNILTDFSGHKAYQDYFKSNTNKIFAALKSNENQIQYYYSTPTEEYTIHDMSYSFNDKEDDQSVVNAYLSCLLTLSPEEFSKRVEDVSDNNEIITYIFTFSSEN